MSGRMLALLPAASPPLPSHLFLLCFCHAPFLSPSIPRSFLYPTLRYLVTSSHSSLLPHFFVEFVLLFFSLCSFLPISSPFSFLHNLAFVFPPLGLAFPTLSIFFLLSMLLFCHILPFSLPRHFHPLFLYFVSRMSLFFS